MNPIIERRRSKRFRNDAISANVSLLDREALKTEPCTLVNISFGGMCLRTRLNLEPGGEYAFLLDLRAPFNDLVMVKARVSWARAVQQGQQDCVAGAEFTESSKGWLGPEE